MFFNAYEAPSNTNYYLYREEFPTILRWHLFDFRLICALGVLGMILSYFKRPRAHLVYIFLFVLGISVILFHIQSRFRLPAAPYFIIFSSYAISYILERLKARQYLKTGFLLAVMIVFYIAIRPDLTYAGFRKASPAIRNCDRTNLADAYIDSYRTSNDIDMLGLAMRQVDLLLKQDSRDPVAGRLKDYIYYMQDSYKETINEND